MNMQGQPSRETDENDFQIFDLDLDEDTPSPSHANSSLATSHTFDSEDGYPVLRRPHKQPREPMPIPIKWDDTEITRRPIHSVPAFREEWQGSSMNSRFPLMDEDFRRYLRPVKPPEPPKSAPSLRHSPSMTAATSFFLVEFKFGRRDIAYTTEPVEDIHIGDFVIVKVDEGYDLGKVTNDTFEEVDAFRIRGRKEVDSARNKGHRDLSPKRLSRKATARDIQTLELKAKEETKALELCRSKVLRTKLPMTIEGAEYQWDRRKLAFYFSSETEKISYSDKLYLVTELYKVYQTQITLERSDIDLDFMKSGLGLSTKEASDVSEPDPDKPYALLIDRLQTVFKSKETYKKLLACRDLRAQKLLDIFQRLLDVVVDPPPSFHRNLVVATQRLAAASELYPISYELADIDIPEYSEYSGGFADIFKANCRGRVVCVKQIRLHRNTQMSHFMKVVSREAVLWGQLRHPNLLPFYGIYRLKRQILLVAPWMEKGDIVEYLKHHTTSNRVVFVYDVACGLGFLHDNGVIHGDLKGANILIDDFGRACLADFGLSSISDREILAMTSYSSAASKGGTVRWQAPELFDPEDEEEQRNSEASDIYAWACVAYEIFAGQVPFAHINREATIMRRVSTGERPARPESSSPSWGVWGLTEEVWFLIQECWTAQADKRPTVRRVIDRLIPVLPLTPHVVNDSSLTPGQFREMIRKSPDENELSIETLESLLSP